MRDSVENHTQRKMRNFVVVPSSAGGNSSFELHSQSMEERTTYHFGPLPSLPWPLGHVSLISFLVLVYAALLLLLAFLLYLIAF